jgi:hypothetical protein
MLRFGMVSSPPVHDAAYGGNSRLAYGRTPTGPMPTLGGRMIAFQSRGNANWNRSKRIKLRDCLVRCGNNFIGKHLEGRLPTPNWAVELLQRWAFSLGEAAALE